MPSVRTTAQKWAVGGLLLLLPFFCNPWGKEMYLQFEAPKLWAAFALGNLCFAFFLSGRVHWAFGLAHAAFSLSVLLTGFGPAQLYPYSYWLCGCFLVIYATSVVMESDGWDQDALLWLWKCIALGGTLSALHGLIQFLGYSWPLHYAPGIDSHTPIALIGQQTKLGAFLAPCAAICLALRGRWLIGAGLCALVCGITGSSFTLFSLAVGCLTVLVGAPSVRRRWLVLLVSAGIALMVIGPRFSSPGGLLDDHGRGLVYRDILRAWLQHPWLGYGPGSFQALFHKYFQSWDTKSWGGGDFIQAHNDYLQVLFEGGLLGFLPMLVVLGAILHAYYTRWNTALRAFRPYGGHWGYSSVLCAQGALAALLVNSLGNFPFTLSPHYLLGMLSAGILLRTARG